MLGFSLERNGMSMNWATDTFVYILKNITTVTHDNRSDIPFIIYFKINKKEMSALKLNE